MSVLHTIASIVPSQGDRPVFKQASVPAMPFADMLDNFAISSEVTPKEHHLATAPIISSSPALKSQPERTHATHSHIKPVIARAEKTIEKEAISYVSKKKLLKEVINISDPNHSYQQFPHIICNNDVKDKLDILYQDVSAQEDLDIFYQKSYVQDIPKWDQNNEFYERSNNISWSETKPDTLAKELVLDYLPVTQQRVSISVTGDEPDKKDVRLDDSLTAHLVSISVPVHMLASQQQSNETIPVAPGNNVVEKIKIPDTSNVLQDSSNVITTVHTQHVLPKSVVQLFQCDKDSQPPATVDVQHVQPRQQRVDIPLSMMPHAVLPLTPANIPLTNTASSSLISHDVVGGDDFADGYELFDYQNKSQFMFQGVSSGKVGASLDKSVKSNALSEKAMTTEMVDRIKNMLKEQQRHDMKITIHHAEYGLISMNLRFSAHSKHVNATFLSDNDELLKIFNESDKEISDVFQNEGLTCQQQVRRK